MVHCHDPDESDSQKQGQDLIGHIYSLAAHNGFLYTGGGNNIRVWNNMNNFCAAFKSNSSGLVKAILISGDRIFTAHQDGKVRVWNTTNHKRVATMPTFFSSRIKHSDVVSCLAFNPDKTLLYSASWDRTFKVWNLSNFKCLDSIKAHDDALNSLVVSTLDGTVYTGSADATVKVWRREEQKGRHLLHRTLHCQESAITALALTPSGSLLYCGSSDGLVNFWELEKHGGVLKGHQLAVLCLKAAGNLVFSGSADKTICVWRREVGAVHTCLSVLSGHTGPVKCLAVEDAGDNQWTVYSGSLDKSVKVWSVSEMAPDLHRIGLMQLRDRDSSWEPFHLRFIPSISK